MVRAISAAVDGASLPTPGSRAILLTPLSIRYFDLYEYWSEQTRKHARGFPLILALDEEARRKAGQEGQTGVIDLSPHFVFGAGEQIEKHCRSLIWVLRVLVLRELVARGHTVYSLDLDAILAGDLQEMLDSLPEADIVAQRDFSLPVDVARTMGFVLCCGFMILRPGRATLEFLDRYCRQTLLEMDDQLALNHLLQRDGLEDQVTGAEYMSFRSLGLRWVCPAPTLVSRDVKYGKVIRHIQQRGESVEELKAIIGV